jgi:hypothetical protein
VVAENFSARGTATIGSIDGSFLELLRLAGAEAEAVAAVINQYEDIRPTRRCGSGLSGDA